MNNMSAWAIRHPTLPIVLFVVLCFMGIVSFIRLPINLNPDISFPLVLVSVSQPGAAPTEIETQVTQKVEGAVRSVSNVRNISSRASEGLSITTVEFQIGTPLDRAISDVRDVVSKIRADLPEGVDEPQVSRIDVEGGAIADYAVGTTGRTPEQLSWYVDNTASKRLLAVSGVAQVTRSGGVSREIRVELDPARMQALGITAAEVNQQLRTLNLNAPGGRAQVGGGEQSIRVLGSARSALDLAATQIRLPGGMVARLGELADVRDATAEERSMSRLNGRPSTSFGVFKARGASDVAALDAVEAEIVKLLAESPDISIKRVFTTVENTRASYRSALTAMIEGSILAVLVVFVFLRDWRATAISALAIPLSAIPTFAFMYAMDFTLNQMSLLALSLVAGVLVDDAIVEIENIVRHMRMGKSGYRAALDAADEIGLAVVATSATIIAVCSWPATSRPCAGRSRTGAPRWSAARSSLSCPSGCSWWCPSRSSPPRTFRPRRSPWSCLLACASRKPRGLPRRWRSCCGSSPRSPTSSSRSVARARSAIRSSMCRCCPVSSAASTRRTGKTA